MIALIQRVSRAAVCVGGEQTGAINGGLLVLLGVEQGDNMQILQRLLHKVVHYRVFHDENGKMNLNVQQAGGALLVVSQFTLAADTEKGLRPSFSRAAAPAQAEMLYREFCRMAAAYVPVQTGRFGADMQVSLVNDGPVTFWLQAA